MALYNVKWQIDVDAETPKEAAETAAQWLREDSDWIFTVTGEGNTSEEIDLSEVEEVNEKEDNNETIRE